MKRFLTILLSFVLIYAAFGCGAAQAASASARELSATENEGTAFSWETIEPEIAEETTDPAAEPVESTEAETVEPAEERASGEAIALPAGQLLFSAPEEQDYAFVLTEASWTVEIDESGNLLLMPVTEEYSQTAITIAVYDLGTAVTTEGLDRMLTSLVAGFTLSAQNVSASEPEDCIVGADYAGRRQQMDCFYFGKQLPITAVAWGNGTRLYFAMLLTSTDEAETATAVLDHLLSTFHTATELTEKGYTQPESETGTENSVLYSPTDELDFAAQIIDPNWTYTISEDSVELTDSTDPFSFSGITLISLTPGTDEIPDTAEELLAMVLDTFAKEASERNGTFSEPRAVVIRDIYSGVEADGSFELLGITFRVRLTAWATDARLYLLYLTTLDENLETVSAVYDGILDTFEPAAEYLAHGGVVPESSAASEPETESIDPTGQTESQTVASFALLADTILVEEEGIKVTLKGIESGWFGPELRLRIENHTGKRLSFSVRDGSVNGYIVDLSLYETIADASANDVTCSISSSDLKLANITTIADLEFVLIATDADSWMTAYTSPRIRLETEEAAEYAYPVDNSGTVLFAEDDIEIIWQGTVEDFWSGTGVKLFFANNTDRAVTISLRDSKVNGIAADSYFTVTLLPGMHAVRSATFFAKDSGTLGTFETASFRFHLYDTNTWETICDSEPVELNF